MATPQKKGAPPCGLWLTVGPDLAVPELLRDLRQIFFVINNGSPYERNMHALVVSGRAGDPEFDEKAGILLGFAKAGGIAAILRGSAEKAKELEADGVLLDSADDLPRARELFGDAGIVGLDCGISETLAAAAYDGGADFVVFRTGKATLPAPGPLRFWTMLTDKPAVVDGPVTNDYCAYYIQAGAGFIGASDYIWSHGKGVMQATSNMLHAIELALEEQRTATQ